MKLQEVEAEGGEGWRAGSNGARSESILLVLSLHAIYTKIQCEHKKHAHIPQPARSLERVDVRRGSR